MEKNNYILLILLFASDFIFAQSNMQKYIVYFKDKPAVENVTSLFSEKALAKRQKFNIAFDEKDFPVNTNYTEQLKNESAIILNTSNWLNASLISVDENKISTSIVSDLRTR